MKFRVFSEILDNIQQNDAHLKQPSAPFCIYKGPQDIMVIWAPSGQSKLVIGRERETEIISKYKAYIMIAAVIYNPSYVRSFLQFLYWQFLAVRFHHVPEKCQTFIS